MRLPTRAICSTGSVRVVTVAEAIRTVEGYRNIYPEFDARELAWLFPDFAEARSVIADHEARQARLARLGDGWAQLVIGDLVGEIEQHLKTHGDEAD
jgi:hypothetical protein